jgi:hypothetical protein
MTSSQVTSWVRSYRGVLAVTITWHWSSFHSNHDSHPLLWSHLYQGGNQFELAEWSPNHVGDAKIEKLKKMRMMWMQKDDGRWRWFTPNHWSPFSSLAVDGKIGTHSQYAKSKLEIYSISRADGTGPLEFPKYPKGVDFENTIPCTYFEKDVFAMSNLNWDIERSVPFSVPSKPATRWYCIAFRAKRSCWFWEPPHLLQPTSPHSSSPLTNFSLKPSTSPANADISKSRYTDNRTCTYNHLMHLLVSPGRQSFKTPPSDLLHRQTHRIRPSPSPSAKKE